MKRQSKSESIAHKYAIITITIMIGCLYSVAPLSTYSAASKKISTTQQPSEKVIKLKSKNHLEKVLDEHDFNLDDVAEGSKNVPRVYFTNFPRDFRQSHDKKEQFIQILLPIILKENELIEKEREKILKLKAIVAKGGKLTVTQLQWVDEVAEYYKLPNWSFDSLLKSVDIIPVTMALGQSAVETGWGISYAAIHKNSAFGVMKGKAVRSYEDLVDSVHKYMRNLNYNPAYKKMREARAKMRARNKEIDGHALVGELYHYSIQRGVYIKKVRSAITKHGLSKFANVELDDSTVNPEKV